MPEFADEDELINDLENEFDYEHSRAFYLYLISKNRDLLDACNVIMAECYSPIELRTRRLKEAARKVIRRIVIALDFPDFRRRFLTSNL